VDQAKVAFLFGEPPEGFDADDPDERGALFSELYDDDDEMTPARLALYEIVANQVADDDPPEVWGTARRLLALGLGREQVLGQLVMATIPQITAALADEEPYDLDAHKAALAALPVPGADEVLAVMTSVVRERQPVPISELLSLTAVALGIPAQQEPHWGFMEHVLDQDVEDEELAVILSNLVIDPATLCAGAVLTHRLGADELDGGYFETEVDLTVSDEAEEVRGPGGVELEDYWLKDVGLAWKGPPGWLSGFDVGTVFAARSSEDGSSVSIEALATPPGPDETAATAIKAAYDKCNEDINLPVSIKELVLTLLAKDRHFFDEPRPPVRELVAAAGLERRGNEVAHTPELWRRADEMDQYQRVISRFESREEADAALSVLSIFNEGDWSDPKGMRDALVVLRNDPDLAEVVADELLGPELEERPAVAAQAALASRFAERLLAVARKPLEVAVARWLMAMADERSGDVFGAEAQLRIAVETFDDWEPAVDRLAWYLSDKGEAVDAARLWRSLGLEEDDVRLSGLEAVAGPSISPPGRNDPCWCGSGRKYKTCHLGKPALAPLPDRLRWLAGKSVNYLRRMGPQALPDILTIAAARAGGDTNPEAIARALSDPLTLDLVLNEGGWFERFLEDRGPLLPGDEALLAASWTLVDRSVYELVSVQPGVGIKVKDLRTAEEIEVRELNYSNYASAGMLICTRVVPDGPGHQFLGGLFRVQPGTEAAVLDLLDDGEPEAIAAWVAALDQPPVLLTRENQPTVICKAVVEVPNELGARRVLDRRYRRGKTGGWEEWYELEPDEKILRATIGLKGSRLTIDTNSEERLERVLGVLRNDIPDLKLVTDDRKPLDLAKARRSTEIGTVGDGEGGGLGGTDDLDGGAPGTIEELAALPPEVLEQIQERFEQRWCDEHVPALGGMTPREAAEDPTRRETLERLLRDFELKNLRQPEGTIVMRPERLREVLGLA
jgi:hypothetical protein